jgi:hypothetical protein
MTFARYWSPDHLTTSVWIIYTGWLMQEALTLLLRQSALSARRTPVGGYPADNTDSRRKKISYPYNTIHHSTLSTIFFFRKVLVF